MISLRNKIGQMLIMGFNGCEVNEHSPVAKWLSGDGLGGVLLFDKDVASGLYGKNIKDKTQIKQLIHQLNHHAQNGSEEQHTIPLFVAIDYEGGAVDRLANVEGSMTTLNASELSMLDYDALREESEQMALSIKSLGFNLNFAPVVDLDLNNKEGIIGALGRSFSSSPEVVIDCASQFVDVFSHYGIACCFKHFPGHGSAVGDTHEGFVDVTDSFKEEELIPYRFLLKDVYKPAMVMTAHVVNRKLDRTGLPATLSHSILTGILRESMGYDGVIISDDLQMQAIAKHYPLDEALELTINAGADMMIFGNQLGSNNAPEIIDRIEHLVTHKKIDEQRIDEAYRRIMRLKHQIF